MHLLTNSTRQATTMSLDREHLKISDEHGFMSRKYKNVPDDDPGDPFHCVIIQMTMDQIKL